MAVFATVTNLNPVNKLYFHSNKWIIDLGIEIDVEVNKYFTGIILHVTYHIVS